MAFNFPPCSILECADDDTKQPGETIFDEYGRLVSFVLSNALVESEILNKEIHQYVV